MSTTRYAAKHAASDDMGRWLPRWCAGSDQPNDQTTDDHGNVQCAGCAFVVGSYTREETVTHPPDALQPLPQSITVIGRRWFQRTYGNTYHTARVLVNGRTVWTSERCYGYGEQYVQTAEEWIYAAGILPEPPRHGNGSRAPLWQVCRDLGVTFEYWAEDVPRQRDL